MKAVAHILKPCSRNSLGELALKSFFKLKDGNCLMKSIGLLCGRKREQSGPEMLTAVLLAGCGRELPSLLWKEGHTRQEPLADQAQDLLLDLALVSEPHLPRAA